MKIIVDELNGLIWSEVLIGLCVFTGIYFSIRTGFLQFTQIKEMLRVLFQKKEANEGFSSFQAFSLAISGRVGTGNIIGVATAIGMGGPGALFWMWVIAIFGSASAFVESTLGQVYKTEVKGEFRGGPAYYIEKALGMKRFAILFAFTAIVSYSVLAPGIQSNSIASVMQNAFGIATETNYPIPFNAIGGLVVLLLLPAVFGGAKIIGRTAEVVVPIIAGVYIIIGMIIIILNFDKIPEVVSIIISSAFGKNELFGGILGSAILWGVKRGIYSNEAGQGSGVHAAATASVKHPAEQGLVQAFSVYIDTLFVCSTTAFMILFTNQYNVIDEQSGTMIVENLKGLDYTVFTQSAISYHFPSFGKEFVAIALFFFAFTTIVAYYYMAETNLIYLLKSQKNKVVIFIFRVIFVAMIYFGSVVEAELIWGMGDIGIGLMVWLNVIAILFLGRIAIKTWQDYKNQKKQGIENPTFDPKKLDIKNADWWEKQN